MTRIGPNVSLGTPADNATGQHSSDRLAICIAAWQAYQRLLASGSRVALPEPAHQRHAHPPCRALRCCSSSAMSSSISSCRSTKSAARLHSCRAGDTMQSHGELPRIAAPARPVPAPMPNAEPCFAGVSLSPALWGSHARRQWSKVNQLDRDTRHSALPVESRWQPFSNHCCVAAGSTMQDTFTTASGNFEGKN